MANDRLFLCCNYCGERYVLAKWYPSTLFSHLPAPDELEPFLDKHFWCRFAEGHAPLLYLDLEGKPGFSIKTESTTKEKDHE